MIKRHKTESLTVRPCWAAAAAAAADIAPVHYTCIGDTCDRRVRNTTRRHVITRAKSQYSKSSYVCASASLDRPGAGITMTVRPAFRTSVCDRDTCNTFAANWHK